MKTLRWLLLGVSFLVLLPLAANTESSLKRKPALVVHDSTGKVVGVVIDTNFFSNGSSSGVPTLAFKIGTGIALVGVTPDYFLGNTMQLLFASADCTGTAYFNFPNFFANWLPPATGSPSVISTSFVKDDGTLYVAPGNPSAPLTVNINSNIVRFSGFPGPDACAAGAFGDTQVVEAQPVANLAEMFTAPFVLH